MSSVGSEKIDISPVVAATLMQFQCHSAIRLLWSKHGRPVVKEISKCAVKSAVHSLTGNFRQTFAREACRLPRFLEFTEPKYR